MSDLRAEIRGLVEAAADDHFYGAWKGGGKAGGGRPSATHKPGLAKTGRDVAQQPIEADWAPDEQASRDALADRLKADGKSWDGKPNSIDVVTSDIPYSAIEAEGGFRSDTYIYRGPEGRPVGYVHLESFGMGYAEGKQVAAVQVFASERGKGYGTAMYDAIQDTTSVNLYDYIGQSHEFTAAGKAFASSWLQHRIELESAA